MKEEHPTKKQILETFFLMMLAFTLSMVVIICLSESRREPAEEEFVEFWEEYQDTIAIR